MINIKNEKEIIVENPKFKYAPIVVFAYNRHDKLERLLKSLEKNKNIRMMELYFFVDIPDKKNKRDIKYNQKVIEFLENYQIHNKEFKNIYVKVSDKHKGLANSIISGVSEVINQHRKVIVLEDDLEVSNDFLDYMQRGLKFYENEKKIWSLAGYSPVFTFPRCYKSDVFLMPRPESWGWGTWIDRWNKCDWEVRTYKKFQKNIMAQMLFNIGGDDLGTMLKRQMQDEQYNSWAIRWGYQQFLEKKYTVYPKESRVIHCGTDNRSAHGAYFDKQKLRKKYKRCNFVRLQPNWRVIWEFRKAYHISLKEKIKNLSSLLKKN